MNNDNLDQLFKRLEPELDYESPADGHESRFMKKLQANQETTQPKGRLRTLWKPIAGIAASIALMISLFAGLNSNTAVDDLADISPELAQTQEFFTNTLAEEMEKLNAETSPDTQRLVEDAMTQMANLDKQYEHLKQQLIESGEDRRVIHAMISNFQSRIDLLQNVLQHIEDVKQLKQMTHENSTTI